MLATLFRTQMLQHVLMIKCMPVGWFYAYTQVDCFYV